MTEPEIVLEVERVNKLQDYIAYVIDNNRRHPHDISATLKFKVEESIRVGQPLSEFIDLLLMEGGIKR